MRSCRRIRVQRETRLRRELEQRRNIRARQLSLREQIVDSEHAQHCATHADRHVGVAGHPFQDVVRSREPLADVTRVEELAVAVNQVGVDAEPGVVLDGIFLVRSDLEASRVVDSDHPSDRLLALVDEEDPRAIEAEPLGHARHQELEQVDVRQVPAHPIEDAMEHRQFVLQQVSVDRLLCGSRTLVAFARDPRSRARRVPRSRAAAVGRLHAADSSVLGIEWTAHRPVAIANSLVTLQPVPAGRVGAVRRASECSAFTGTAAAAV
jgi:hypothetical protein